MKIKSQQELDNLIKKHEGYLDCFVLLKGNLSSSKNISINNEGNYEIYHLIDDSTDTIKHDEFQTSYLGELIDKGVIYTY